MPEEIVRQRLLLHMIDQKGFPASLVAVEQLLGQLPHLSTVDPRRVPKRRADIICFANRNHLLSSSVLHPLLLVECKAIKLAPAVMSQVVGYNHFVGSSFIAVVNQDEIRTGWYDREKKDYMFVDYLPSYLELLKSLGN